MEIPIIPLAVLLSKRTNKIICLAYPVFAVVRNFFGIFHHSLYYNKIEGYDLLNVVKAFEQVIAVSAIFSAIRPMCYFSFFSSILIYIFTHIYYRDNVHCSTCVLYFKCFVCFCGFFHRVSHYAELYRRRRCCWLSSGR